MKIQKSISLKLETWDNLHSLAARNQRTISSMIEILLQESIKQNLRNVDQHLIKHQK